LSPIHDHSSRRCGGAYSMRYSIGARRLWSGGLAMRGSAWPRVRRESRGRRGEGCSLGRGERSQHRFDSL
jgi:hypothetical protein